MRPFPLRICVIFMSLGSFTWLTLMNGDIWGVQLILICIFGVLRRTIEKYVALKYSHVIPVDSLACILFWYQKRLSHSERRIDELSRDLRSSSMVSRKVRDHVLRYNAQGEELDGLVLTSPHHLDECDKCLIDVILREDLNKEDDELILTQLDYWMKVSTENQEFDDTEDCRDPTCSWCSDFKHIVFGIFWERSYTRWQPGQH